MPFFDFPLFVCFVRPGAAAGWYMTSHEYPKGRHIESAKCKARYQFVALCRRGIKSRLHLANLTMFLSVQVELVSLLDVDIAILPYFRPFRSARNPVVVLEYVLEYYSSTS